MKRTTRREREPAAWTSEDLAAYLLKVCGTQFSTGDVEPDPKTKGHKFWVLLQTANEDIARMAVVRISPAFAIQVDMAKDERGGPAVTIFRTALERTVAKAATALLDRKPCP